MDFKKLKYAAMGAVASVAVLSAADAEAQQVNSTVSVSVDNTLDLVVDNNMNFGEIVALSQSGAGVAATITVNNAGALQAPVNNGGASDGRIEIIDDTAESNTEISISGGAPTAVIDVLLDNVTAPVNNGLAFTLTNFTYNETAGNNNGNVVVSTPFTITLDANGTNVIQFGARLGTVLGTTYTDVAYTGGFDVTFSY